MGGADSITLAQATGTVFINSGSGGDDVLVEQTGGDVNITTGSQAPETDNITVLTCGRNLVIQSGDGGDLVSVGTVGENATITSGRGKFACALQADNIKLRLPPAESPETIKKSNASGPSGPFSSTH